MKTDRQWVKRGHWPILVRPGNDHGRAQMPMVPAHSDPAVWISPRAGAAGHLSGLFLFSPCSNKRLWQNRVSQVTDLVLRPDVVHAVSFSWNLVTGRQRQELSRVKPGHSQALTSGGLTCWSSAFGWRSSLACRHSRSPLLYKEEPPPPPAPPERCPRCRCHLWSRGRQTHTDLSVVTAKAWPEGGSVHAYRLPSSGGGTLQSRRHSVLCRNTLLHPPSWPPQISAQLKRHRINPVNMRTQVRF